MAKVNFIIAGTQKGGTTALSTFLNQHPQISFAQVKEAHFFDTDYLFKAPPPPYHIYHRHFKNKSGCIFGEATPIYMYWNPAIKRIKDYNPDMKLIFILRNPIERAYSHYIMEYKRYAETLSFSEAIRVEEARLRKFPNKQHRVYSYVDRGYYSRQIKRIFEEFPRDQLLFLKTEDLRERHTSSLHYVCDFLSIKKIDTIETKIIFSNVYEEMNLDDRKFLLEKFSKEIDDLEKLLGWDCSSWRE